MLRWLLVALLALQAHFAASHVVPLDEEAQRALGGVLKWVWPWAIGDNGPVGYMSSTGIPMPGFALASTAATVTILAALALLGVWVPFAWWKPLATTGAVLSLTLMALFIGLTKLLPIATALVILAAALGYWSPMESAGWRTE